MFKRILCFVGIVLVSVNACAAEGAAQPRVETARLIEHEPSRKLLSEIEAIFEGAKTIHVRFTPAESMGRASFERGAIEEHWVVHVILRCRQTCLDSAPQLHKALSLARRVDSTCPPRFTAMLTFADQNDQDMGVVYVHESRECVVINDISYFVPGSALSELIEAIDHLRW
jgi:hypothetical protein